MTIVRIETDDEILTTCEVMLQLRPEVPPDEYLARVRRMMSSGGYLLAASTEDGAVRAVAGYRIFEMLYCRRLMSIDDLVTDERSRSSGFGKELLDWLKQEARDRDCSHVFLNSRVHRAGAHRFYFREDFIIEAFHFMTALNPTLPAPLETRDHRRGSEKRSRSSKR